MIHSLLYLREYSREGTALQLGDLYAATAVDLFRPMYSKSANTSTTAACAITKAIPSALGATQPVNNSTMLSTTQTTFNAIMVHTAMRAGSRREATKPTKAANGSRMMPASRTS